jgi:hypothetical protein
MLFTVNLLSRRLKDATKQHLEIARDRPLRYLKGTIDHGMVFAPGTGQWILSGQADADFAGDHETSRSTTGYFSKLGEYGSISYHSALERKISTSTQQAETYALASHIKDTTWIRHLLHDLGCAQTSPTPVDTDNQGTFLQSSKQVNHATAKHFRVSQAYIRGAQMEDNLVKVNKVETQRNGADIFTKPLSKELFRRHKLAVMGPQDEEARGEAYLIFGKSSLGGVSEYFGILNTRQRLILILLMTSFQIHYLLCKFSQK